MFLACDYHSSSTLRMSTLTMAWPLESSMNIFHYILNRQYQEDNTELYASWDFTGDPCPVVRYELEIRRFDGVAVLPRETVPQGKYQQGNIQCFQNSK